MKNKYFLLSMLAMLALGVALPALADNGEDSDITFFGLELEKLISLANSILALVLFIITFISYRRNHYPRLLYVSIAFALFSIKSFLVSLELFMPELSWADPVATVLDFAILLIFFIGLLRK